MVSYSHMLQVGYIMFYVRSPAEGGQESIAEALSVLWHVVPSVQGIFFKDLKQTLRKEQCDVSCTVETFPSFPFLNLLLISLLYQQLLTSSFDAQMKNPSERVF